MRFQTPALATLVFWQFASLVVSDASVRVISSTNDDGELECRFQTEGLCSPQSPALVQTPPFGAYDPETGCSLKNVPVDFECDVDEPGGTMFINKNSNPPLIHYEGPAAGSLGSLQAELGDLPLSLGTKWTLTAPEWLNGSPIPVTAVPTATSTWNPTFATSAIVTRK